MAVSLASSSMIRSRSAMTPKFLVLVRAAVRAVVHKRSVMRAAPSAHWSVLRHCLDLRGKRRPLRRRELVRYVEDAGDDGFRLGVEARDHVGAEFLDRSAIDGRR